MKALLAVVLIVVSAIAVAQSKSELRQSGAGRGTELDAHSSVVTSDIVSLFRQFIASASEVEEYSKVALNERENKWVRSYYKILDVKFDIKKTDSLVNPQIAIVTLSHIRSRSPLFDTKELAEATNEVHSPKYYAYVRDDYTIRYQIVGGRWVTKDLAYTWELLPPIPGAASAAEKHKISMTDLSKYKRGESPLIDRWVVQ